MHINLTGIQCNTTGYFYYSYQQEHKELFTIGHDIVPNPDIIMTGFGKKLYHKSFDPEITLFSGQKRAVIDDNDNIFGFFEFIDPEQFYLIQGNNVILVQVQDDGWNLYHNSQKTASILRIDTDKRKHYEENGYAKETRFHIVISEDTPEAMLPLILSIPILGY